VTIQPSGQQALLSGDNTAAPVLDFLEDPDEVRPGDRVVTSGDGGVFPGRAAGGQVAERPAGGCACGSRRITSGSSSCGCCAHPGWLTPPASSLVPYRGFAWALRLLVFLHLMPLDHGPRGWPGPT
jgi:hypothetical protein